MFLKLLKYEFKSIGKWYLGLYGLSLIFSIILGFWVKGGTGETLSEWFSSSPILQFLAGLFFLAGFVIYSAMLVSTFVIIIRRFKNSIFDRQGYLTMTLPANTHQIILSKLLTALFWSLFSVLAVIVLSLLTALIAVGSFSEFFNMLNQFIGEFRGGFEQGFEASSGYFLKIDSTILSLVLPSTLVETIVSILLFYLSISLGHMAENNKVLLSFVAYFSVGFVSSYLSSFLVSFFSESMVQSEAYTPTRMLIQIAMNCVLGAIYYFATHYIIKNKLNI